MPREWRVRLEDILEAIERIGEYIRALDEATNLPPLLPLLRALLDAETPGEGDGGR